jgi:hypothetical protein
MCELCGKWNSSVLSTPFYYEFLPLQGQSVYSNMSNMKRQDSSYTTLYVKLYYMEKLWGEKAHHNCLIPQGIPTYVQVTSQVM